MSLKLKKRKENEKLTFKKNNLNELGDLKINK